MALHKKDPVLYDFTVTQCRVLCQVPQNLDTLSLSKYDGWNPKS